MLTTNSLRIACLLLVPAFAVSAWAQDIGGPDDQFDEFDQAIQDIIPADSPGQLIVPPAVKEEPKPPSGDIAVLRAVDKITARVTDLEAPINETATFGTLQITMRYCYKNPPEETPEVTVFLEIEDHQPDVEPQRAFNGWMFASSPALSAMEHPVYDVWVIDCKAAAPEISDGSVSNTP